MPQNPPQNPFDKFPTVTPVGAPAGAQVSAGGKSRKRAARNPFDELPDVIPTPAQPAPAAPPTTPAPGFLGNLEIGGRRALLAAADAGRVMEDALGAASRGDFGPLGQLVEQAGRSVAPFVSAAVAPYGQGASQFVTEQAAQAPRIGELTRQREERMAAQPELYSKEAIAEHARLNQLAALDPSLSGKITRGAAQFGAEALPAIVTGVATGGSVPAVAGVVGLQSLNAPETLIPNVALAAIPIPLGKVIAPIVRRIKAARAPVEIPTAGVAPEIPAVSAETALPGVEAPPPISEPAIFPQMPPREFPVTRPGRPGNTPSPFGPGEEPVAVPGIVPPSVRPARPGAAPSPRGPAGPTAPPDPLQTATQKLGTDSVSEISEMIANANRRFNETVTVPGGESRPLTPAERQSAIEDYNRIRTLTKQENNALAEVLPERTYAPVQEGAPTSRAISDIPLSERDAQLDANLRQLKAFFGSEDLIRESKIAAAVGADRADPGVISTSDLGLETVPVPVRPADAVPVTRRVSVDDISLGRDTLSKGRMFGVQESLKEGVKAETKVVPLKEQVEPITVTPDPNRPGRFIVGDDGNHRVALLKLQGVTEDIPVKSFETPAQTAAIRTSVGPRAGEVSPIEAEITDQMRGMSRPSAARNMEPLEVEPMAGAEQAPLFETAPRKSIFRRALNLAADIYQIPKSLMASGDDSFLFRQGAIFLLPPSRWRIARGAIAETLRAMIPDRPTSIGGAIKAQFRPETERFKRMVAAIASDPDAVAGMNSGLKLASQSGGFRKADGEFMSRIADRIPGVRESNQAYTIGADFTRLQTFKLYKQVIDSRAAQEGFSADQIKRGYEAAARWINIGSGRGSFGEKVDKVFDALGFFIFSPRFVASRIQVLNPLTYLRNVGTAEGRTVLKLQMSEMAQFSAMVGATLMLAKAAGMKVDVSREKGISLSLGNYHYDVTAGLSSVIRLGWNVLADTIRAAKGEPPKGQTAVDVGSRFLRGKAAPIPSAFIDFWTGKTFEGKPFNLSDAAIERISPMAWKDFAEAYQREGLFGPLKVSPELFGPSVNYREPKPIDAAIEQRPELLNELTRLQIRLGDPRRKPNESDDAYKGRQEAIANLYSRFAVGLMSSRAYANQTEEFKKEAFDLLHERVLDAVNTRDRRIGQFQPDVIIGAVRRAEIQGKLRQKRIAARPPL